MERRFFVFASSILFLLPRAVRSQNNIYNKRAVPCLSTGQEGYESLVSLQEDINDARALVVDDGETPFDTYDFMLCPETTFTVTDPIVPALDNINIRCGTPSLSTNNCILSGGTTHVDMQDFDSTSFPVRTATISGVTSSGFTDAAVAGDATEMTSLNLLDTVYTFDTATNVVRQQRNDATPPFSVTVFLAEINDGATTAEMFLNVGGELTIQGVEVNAATARLDGNGNTTDSNAFIGAIGNSASVFISPVSDNTGGLEMTASDINIIVGLSEGADAIIDDVVVNNMDFVGRVVKVDGAGGQAFIRNTVVENNLNEPQTNLTQWRVFEALNSAFLDVQTTTMNNNQNVEHHVAVVTGASAEITDLTVTSATGSLGSDPATASSIVFASTNANVELSGSTFEDSSQLSTAIFVFQDSVVNTRRVCLDTLATEGLVFVQDGSQLPTREENAIQDSPTGACADEGERLIQGDPGAGCFDAQNGNPCTFTCENWAEFTDCEEIPLVNITDTPSSAPSAVPSLSPSSTSAPTGPATPVPSGTPSQPPSTGPTPTEPSPPVASDSPSGVPTASLAPTLSQAPTMATGRPTISPTLPVPSSGPSSSPSAVPSFAPSGIPSSLPTIPRTDAPSQSAQPSVPPPSASPTQSPVQQPTLSPTVTARPSSSPPPSTEPTTSPPTTSPTITNAPSFVDPKTSGPTSSPSRSPMAPVTSPPTVSSAPSSTATPTKTATPSAPSTATPSAPSTAEPSTPSTASPTRCRRRPSKGRAKWKGKGQTWSKGKGRDVKAVRGDGEHRVYHYVFVEKPRNNNDDSNIPWCDETPHPTHAPIHHNHKTPPPISSKGGKGRIKGTKSYKQSKSAKYTKSKFAHGKKRYLEAFEQSAFGHEREGPSYLRKSTLLSWWR